MTGGQRVYRTLAVAVAAALFAGDVGVRFLINYSLEDVLAAMGLSQDPPVVSMAWVVSYLVHTTADAIAYGLVIAGMLLALWHWWRTRQRAPA